MTGQNRPNADQLGYRMKFGVLGPSTNTVVQPDFDDLRVHGVTNHYSRIVVNDTKAVSNESFMAGAWEISDNTIEAVKGVLTCKPNYLVMGMSAVTFFGGAEGAVKWRENVEQVSGLGVSTGSEATAAALAAYGGIKKVAFFSPYYPTANAEVRNFLSDHGYETVRDIPLQCPSWTAIAEVSERRIIDTFKALDGDFGREAARKIDGLRTNGIAERVHGFGRLMSEY